MAPSLHNGVAMRQTEIGHIQSNERRGRNERYTHWSRFGKKCISTEQVKALGSLFSSDDGRYNLYDALYKHVADEELQGIKGVLVSIHGLYKTNKIVSYIFVSYTFVSYLGGL